MEKKYLVGYVYGKEAVMWDDVKDFTETSDEETGLTTITFKENNIEYTYTGNEIRGYRELNNKAPFITSYKLIGRRTALRHDYLDNNKRREVRSFNTQRDFDEDDLDFEILDDYEDDDPLYNRNCGVGCGSRSHYHSCGSSYYHHGCGGSGGC